MRRSRPQLKTLHGDGGRRPPLGGLALASVGEEAGFATGWGRTYYWDDPSLPT